LLDVHEQRYENAGMLKHLGFLLTNTNEVETEIKARILADNKCYRALGLMLKGRYLAQSLTPRLLMSYIYGAPILDVSRSHTTTQHSR
jgi:hypothetical protein